MCVVELKRALLLRLGGIAIQQKLAIRQDHLTRGNSETAGCDDRPNNMRVYAFPEDLKRINDIKLACLAVRMRRDCHH
jgi:hypothetical protein